MKTYVALYRRFILPRQKVVIPAILGVVLSLVLVETVVRYRRYRAERAFQSFADARDDPAKLAALAETHAGTELGARAAFRRIELAVRQERLDEAESLLRDFVDRDQPGGFRSPARVQLGHVLAKQGKYAEAERCFAAAAAEAQNPALVAEAMLNAGRCAWRRGDAREAIRWFEATVANSEEDSFYRAQAEAALLAARRGRPGPGSR